MATSGINHGHIRDIVAQVKSGVKSKTDAFNELKSILQSTARRSPTQQPETENSMGDDGQQNTRFSTEDRRHLISKLIEKKRQTRGTDAVDMLDSDEGPESFDESLQQPSRSESRGGRSRMMRFSTPSRSRSLSAGRQRSPGGFNETTESRLKRIAQTEASIREEMFKDYTFKPQIRPLPVSYGAPKDQDLPFNDRVAKWQRERNVEQKRRSEIHKDSEVLDCTFQPRINRASAKAAKEIRGDNDEPVSERLFKTNELLQNQRSKFIEEQLRSEHQNEIAECTFKPQLATKQKAFTHVKPKYEKPAPVDKSVLAEDPSKLEYTFTPKIRGVGRSMSAAKLYCSSNVIDRLTRPVSATTPKASSDETMRQFDNSFGDRHVMNVSTFMSSLQGTSTQFQTPGRLRASSAPRERTSSKDLSTADSEQRQRAFKEFISRQLHCSEKRSQHVKELERVLKPKFTPKLCRKSIIMTEQYSKGEFLDRLSRDINKRSDHDAQLSVTVDKECTFTPAIHPKSKARPGRSVYELSKGDLQRKENKQRVLRLRAEQELLAEATFQPEITQRARSAGRSKLGLSTDTSAFLEKFKIDREKNDERRRYELDVRRSEELKGCTFQPEIRDCPSYIKRIAKSMVIIKSARAETLPPQKVKAQWK